MVTPPETREAAAFQETLLAEEVVETLALAIFMINGPSGTPFQPHGISIFEVFTSFWLVAMAKRHGVADVNQATHEALRVVGFAPRGKCSGNQEIPRS